MNNSYTIPQVCIEDADVRFFFNNIFPPSEFFSPSFHTITKIIIWLIVQCVKNLENKLYDKWGGGGNIFQIINNFFLPFFYCFHELVKGITFPVKNRRERDLRAAEEQPEAEDQRREGLRGDGRLRGGKRLVS